MKAWLALVLFVLMGLAMFASGYQTATMQITEWAIVNCLAEIQKLLLPKGVL